MQKTRLLCALMYLLCASGATSRSLHGDDAQVDTRAIATSAPITAVESRDGILFSEGDSKVLFYQRHPKSLDGRYTRANYIHPLFDLEGNELTEDFPADHLHHRGIFWAWHQLWVENKKIGDGWTCSRFSWDVQQMEADTDQTGPASLRVKVLWQSPDWLDGQGNPKPLVEESTLIQIHPQSEGIRRIDFDIQLLALEANTRLGGSEDDKGYGGFSVRVHLPDDVQFHGREGIMAPQSTAISGSPWLDITASFNADGQRSGLAILCHPTSAGYPQPWILRAKRSMQNAAYPGQDAVLLSTTQPMVLRYRLVLHRDVVDSKTIDRWQAEYAEPSSPLN